MSNEMEPLPLPCVCGYREVTTHPVGPTKHQAWCEACGCGTPVLDTREAAIADWNTIQRALRPNAVTIELPEPPEGWAWNHEILMVDTTEQLVPGCTIRISAKPIPPTPAEIREASQAWAAEQKPGTVARYGGVTWFWHQWCRDTFMVAHEYTGSDDPRYSGKTWKTWDERLDGIGPEHILCTPSEAGEDE